MLLKLLAQRLVIVLFILLGPFLANAQEKTITGMVMKSSDGSPVAGVSVIPKGSKSGTQTDVDGSYRVSVSSATATLVFSSVGFVTKEVSIDGQTVVNVSLESKGGDLNEIVVIGYGSARKRDLTGATSSVSEKQFNRGIVTSPDQLIQGKATGVQIVSASGAPNAAISVRIRGNASVRAGNEPLYVVDGVQLANNVARPGSSVGSDIGATPGGNALSFLNPNDIASIDILKDASATAIYGSRGSNGVVLITTKKGKTGAPRIEFNSSWGTSKIARKIDYATASEYRAGLKKYGLTSGDLGADVDAFESILQTGNSQNYGVGLSGGTGDATYKFALNYFDQNGIVAKTGFTKYNADYIGSFKFLDSKKLLLDVHLLANQSQEDVAPIGNNSGFRGSLIGAALQWNPTRPLYKPDGTLSIDQGGDNINPVAYSRAYDDKINVSTILASISPTYKFNDWLDYKLLMSVTQSKGGRRQQLREYLNVDGIQGLGAGNVANEEIVTKQATHTLNFNKELSSNFKLGVLLGYEFQQIDRDGSNQSARGFVGVTVPYYDALAFSSQGTRNVSSFVDPSSKLNSYFTRANINVQDKYLLTATFRADGSNKFGKDNRYAYFPSAAAAWNVSNEDFLKDNAMISNLKLRVGYGITGNQDFPAGSAIERFTASGPGAFAQTNLANPTLKWQKDAQSNAGIDIGFFKGRLTATVDYFNKKTTQVLARITTPTPSPGASYWTNLPNAEIVNKGLEVALSGSIIEKADLTWDVGVFATFQNNVINGLSGPLLTGEINGQGLSGAFVQRMANGQPLNAFYVRQYNGIDKTTGQADLSDNGTSFFFMGSGLPKTLLGLNTNFGYKKFNLGVAMNGAFGNFLYNNTLNAVLPINNLGSRNVDPRLLVEGTESLSSPITTSSRYLEKGDFLRLSNATLSYQVGAIGKVIKTANIFITGQNLFVLTKFRGFDPEVNVDKNIDGVPSFGIEYAPYPASRTFLLGLSFSL